MLKLDINSLLVLGAVLILLGIGIYKMQNESPSQVSSVNSYKTSTNYHLIVGSFMNEEFALNMSDSLLNRGFGSIVLPIQNGFYRVSIFSSKNKSESYKMRNLYKEDISKIWVYQED